MSHRTPTAVFRGLLLFASSCGALPGSLTSSKPPAPTFKTLGEIEPRGIIKANSESIDPIVIDQSRSFVLSEDMVARSGQHALTINASSVTIDLYRFTVIGDLGVVGSHDI